ncbi:MAG TPA: PQQ-binding-like beta-propeller repeat protein [Chloroflexota bacterium]
MLRLLRRVAICGMLGALVFPTAISAQGQSAQPSFRSPTTDELTQTKNPGNDWITFGGALNNQRYSTLNQINTSNVSQLKGAWLTRLGSGRGSKYKFEADPLVIDGIMYIPTGNDDIFALDATTGRKLWDYSSDIPQTNDLICCGWDNRGVAAGEDKIFSGQLDGSFVALDQKTGKVVWRTQLEDYHDGYSMTGYFRYYDGMVFTGMSGGENGIRGRVYALDAKTGQEVWRFYTVAGPGDIGGDSWPAGTDAYTHGGATVWQAPAIDPELGMAYFSTGNAGPDYDGSIRPGDNLFAASIVAIDLRTGQYRWHFQEVHHDIWDYDAPSPVVLFDTNLNGQARKGVYQCGKTGWCYFLDRTNGQPLIGIDEKPVKQEPRQSTAPTQPFPVGDAFVTQCGEPIEGYLTGCIFDPFWDVAVVERPNQAGGSNFSPTTYSPQTGYVYVMGQEQNNGYAVVPQTFQLGRRYTAGANVSPIGSSIANTFTALDSHTNKIAWQARGVGEAGKGAASTAGGLVFTGQADGNMLAYDARTGDVLWKFQVGWGISAPPMTYSVNGTQYVAVAAGGNRGGVTTLDGDAVWAFSLNGTLDEVAAAPPVQTKVDFAGPVLNIGDDLAKTARTGDPAPQGIFDGSIAVADYSFLPSRVQIPAGTTLTWTNRGSVIHTATDNHQAWDTGDISPGASASVEFDTPGTYSFTCKPHPWMYGQIIVN